MQRINTLPHNGDFPHEIPIEGCAECHDDLLERTTGCRYGEPDECDEESAYHEDCWR